MPPVSIEVETVLRAHPDRVWEEVRKPRLLLFVAAPMIRFRAVRPDTFPEIWRNGVYVTSLRLYGLIPFGRQTIVISYLEAIGETRRLRDDGYGGLIREWDHLMEVSPHPDGTLYRDTVAVEAGWLTRPAAAFARRYYAHRQRRWRALVAANFDYGRAARG